MLSSRRACVQCAFGVDCGEGRRRTNRDTAVGIEAIIFDLDGVITDTAEYHYRAWQRLADEEGLPFDRHINERLRGVSRRASLEIMLAGRPTSEERIAEMMARKNRYYVSLLERVTPSDLLPGALDLITEARTAGIKIGIASASKNAQTVLDRLGICDLLDAIADGYETDKAKPAPDLFLRTAAMLTVRPAFCAVVEDAAVGVDAALAAGMWALGLGPEERVGHAHARFDSLNGVTLSAISSALESAAWIIFEPELTDALQNRQESVFTTGNGYLCVRGALEERHPGDSPASFIHRLWDDTPTVYSELANIPRWWGVDVWVNGVRFGLERGHVLWHRRRLDMRTGVLARSVRWQPEAGGPMVDLHFERFASLADSHLAVVRLRLESAGGDATVRVRTGFDAHVDNLGLVHWNPVAQDVTEDHVSLQVRTRGTQLDLALAAEIGTQAGNPWTAQASDADGQPAVERRATLRQGESITLEKMIGLASSLDGDDPLRMATATAATAREKGYDRVAAQSAAEWARVWQTSDVIIEGDRDAQAAIRFSLFQLLIAAPRFTQRASIGAKTLSGYGYRHHTFWDTEIFMLPFFIHTQPGLARNMLMYRWHNLPGARAKAQGNGYEGAQFPWESAGDGTEVTPVWLPHFADPHKLVRIWTGDIEIHITADIAYAAMQYWRATGDDAWMRDYGAELIVDGARFWASAARRAEDGLYHYRDVIGPDEFHDHVDDNAYTNYMARWHLETALSVLSWLKGTDAGKHDALLHSLDLGPSRLAHWREIISHMYLPLDAASGLVEQFSGYFQLEDVDQKLMRDPERTHSMQGLLGIEGVTHTQAIKQPDVLILQHLLANEFTPEQIRANYAYYNPRTDHELGSSLGPSISAIMACRAGDIAAAYEHFQRAAGTDLQDARGNAADGIHGANAGGLWQAVVLGFAGLSLGEKGWQTHPSLPDGWTRLAFRFWQRGRIETVDVRR